MSSFYDLASLVMIPSGKKAGKVYSQKPLTTDGQLDFTRASTATRIGSDGLIEKTRTNNVLYSNDFNTGFSKTRASMVSGQAGYDGTNDAWSFVDTADNSTHLIVQTVASSQVQTFSVYAKAGAVNFIVFRYEDSTVDYAYFDLANGILGTVDSDYITAKITSVGNGWYRCEAARTSANKVVILSAQSDNDPTYAGAGTAALYIQDAQLEPGLVATSYIETTTAAVSVGSVDNMPRLNYTPGSATSCPSLLLEPQRTNLVTYSEYGSEWFNNETTTTLSTIISSPSGENAVYKVTDNTSSSQHRIESREAVTTGTEYTFSAFVKQESNSDVDFAYLLFSSKFTATRYYFNIKNGTVGNGNGTIENYGNGWYKISGSATANSTGNAVFGVNLAKTNGQPTYTGTGNGSMFVWGLQIEAGSYATSYIPTFGATVTRVADDCSKTGISGLIGQTEGTLFVEAKTLENGADCRITYSDGTINNRISIEWDANANTIKGFIGGSGNVDTTSYDQTNMNKIALVYNTSDARLFINGTKVSTDTSVPTLSGMDRLEFSSQGGSNPFVGNTNKLLIIKEKLNDEQAIQLTSLDS